jgi:hypothetical protein
MTAAIHHAADATMSPTLTIDDSSTDCGHAADDLMSGNRWKLDSSPFVASCGVQVRMANTAVRNLDGHVRRPGGRRSIVMGESGSAAERAA